MKKKTIYAYFHWFTIAAHFPGDVIFDLESY